jgi:hypothetical protein
VSHGPDEGCGDAKQSVTAILGEDEDLRDYAEGAATDCHSRHAWASGGVGSGWSGCGRSMRRRRGEREEGEGLLLKL